MHNLETGESSVSTLLLKSNGLPMSRRILLILLAAFAVAAACTYIVYRVVGNHVAMAGSRKTTTVVVAARDIKLGTIIAKDDLSTAKMVGSPPKDAVLNEQDVIGRGVISSIYQGEPILDTRLAAKGSGGGLAAMIPPGMRACAVKVNEVVGVAGFATPGMRVDVLISGNPSGSPSAQGSRVRTLLQDIQVLSAGTDIQRDAEGKPKQVQVVNLLVTPEQAEALSLASAETRIQLVLRNPLDTKIAQTTGTAVSALFGNSAPVKADAPRIRRVAPARPKIYLVEVINGSKRTEAKFPEVVKEKQ
jgi:pilus assembly protein CpaB